MKSSLIILSIILLISGLFRMVGISSLPMGFTWDEAALGYNAYSLLETGKDEHAQPFPLIFKSFGDYKPGLYIYLTTPLIDLLGLTEASTRATSAILGTLLILLLYILTRQLFPKYPKLALGVALVSATNPWLIQFSRGAWESNLCIFLTLLGINLWLSRRYFYSGVFFSLSLFSYQGAKLLTPLVVLILLLVFKPKKISKSLLTGGVALLVALMPLVSGFSSQSGRLKVFSLTSYVRSPEQVNSILKTDKTTDLNFNYYLFHSEKLQMFRTFSLHYLNNLSPKFLFTSGDWMSFRHSIPFYGYFHIAELITIPAGVYFLLSKGSRKSAIFLFLLLLLAPLPASLSRDLVSGVRALPFAVPLVILSGLGLSQLFSKKIYLIPISALLLFGIVYFTDMYVTHAKYYTAEAWLSPYKPAMAMINRYSSEYENIFFSNQLGQPYIFVLFYGKVDPHLYQKNSIIIPNMYGDVDEVSKFSKYTFGKLYWPSLRGNSSTLFVGGQYELPEQDLNIEGIVRYGDIRYPDGDTALRIVGLP